MRKYFYNIIFFLVFLINNAFAEIVNKISIFENSRISDNTIIDIIDFKKGKNYSEIDINNFQKKLFETNFFSEVNLKLNKDILEIRVTENPLVEFFLVRGVKNKNREDLIYNSLLLGQNKIFSQSLLNLDIETIKNIFKESGYFKVNISPQISKLANGNLNIVLDVNRGVKYKIKRIFFIGNKFFTSSKLLDSLSSSEHGWWKFLSSTSIANLNRLEFDKNLLKNFYLNEGFYDVQILSSDIEFLKGNYISVTFVINSGEQYKFSNFEIIDNDKILNEEIFENLNKIISKQLKGSFSLKKINNIKDKIYLYLNLKKIEFVKFKISDNKSDDNVVSVKFIFEKTPRSYINKINIKGNSITEEEVIRRELVFSEGDSFTKYKLDKSQDNLKATGIFKNIKTKLKKNENETIDLDLSVEEQPTGSISAGVGVGSAGSSITTGISENNLFGKGIKVNSNLSVGTESIKGNISTTVPDFNNSDNDFFFNVFALSTDFENASYQSKVIGSNLATRYYLLEDISFKPGIGIDRDEIETNSSASQLYRSREGNYMTFKTFYNLETNKTDSMFQPTKGYRLNYGQILAIPGSDVPYIENNLNGAYYYPVSSDYILNLKSGLNSINAFNNNDVKLSDRKFLSSRNLRGFENYGIGPKDGNDHIGGNYSAYSSISSTFPNPFPDKWNANSIVFFDAGNVWGVDYDSSIDSNKIRSSVGIGLDWVSPLGPLSFIFAQPLSSENGDLEEVFSFQLGSSF